MSAPKVPPGIVLVGFVPWAILAAWYGWHASSAVTQASWQETAATVTQVKVESVGAQVVKRCNNASDAHQTVVTYAYEVDGKRHESHRFDYEHEGDFSCSREESEARAREYERAGSVKAFYDPSNPADAVLAKPETWQLYLFGPLLLVAGVGIALLHARQRRIHRATNPFH